MRLNSLLPVTALACTSLSAQIQVRLVTDQADSVLALLAIQAAGRVPQPAEWDRLFQCEGQRRLEARGKAFKQPTDPTTLRAFVQSPELQAKTAALAQALVRWKQADLEAAARKALAYLPAGARIEARVYPVIKPRSNSFVFEGNAIFFYLDPEKSAEECENTLIHELHHIGFSSCDRVLEANLAKLPPPVREANEWVGAFGEGFAMLAAAGDPDRHPHAASKAETRARWDRDMARFDEDLKQVEAFLLDVAEGRLKGQAVAERGMSFFGEQGAWYTVGWRMASTIERSLGRKVLLECMVNPCRLLSTYNRIAAAGKGATWSPHLLRALAEGPS